MKASRKNPSHRERVKGVGWGLALNARGLGFDFKYYKGKLNLKRNCYCGKGPMDERGSLEWSSRGTDCGCCTEHVTNPVRRMCL